MNLPEEYAARMRARLGDEAGAYFDALDSSPSKTLRLNREKFSGSPDFNGVTVTETALPDIYGFEGTAGGRNPLHHAGAYYIQEFAAALPVLSSPVREGMRVLDLCAAPGGKTSQLASAVGRDGLVVSNEYSRSRAQVLLGNVERMGFRNCIVYTGSPDVICSAFEGTFDLVLTDVPCSGEGMFRREDDAVTDWSVENVLGCAARQREILEWAYKAVAPGGCLVYSTCTFSPEEDEDNVKWLLERFPHLLCEEPRDVLPEGMLVRGDVEGSRRAYPHRVPGEGQFFAVLRKSADAPVETVSQNGKKGKNAPAAVSPADKAETSAAREFMKEFFGDGRYSDVPLWKLRDDIVLPSSAMTPAVLSRIPAGALTVGVKIGTVNHGRLVPHHQFFSALGAEAAVKLELSQDDPRVAKYLHGEGFPLSDTGLSVAGSVWGVLSVAGCAVGGIRIAGGYVKNHYPKGLRE